MMDEEPGFLEILLWQLTRVLVIPVVLLTAGFLGYTLIVEVFGI